ncbi:glycosyltransferase [Dactylosporangium darangshiense]|uniref:Glycosyltransferase family 1 protein n=1 Tax=Dactylosporangium darangshiense TaxID=579108 RepID=A0ABP8D9T0_9ACTN
MRIALVSAQANPLMLGGPGAGGRHTHVAALSEALGRLGHEVVVYVRREDPDAPAEVAFAPGVTVERVAAGPERVVPAGEQLPLMGDFGRALAARWETDAAGPDVVHAHYWLSGLAALTATAEIRRPVVVTYHGLAAGERRHLPVDRNAGPGPRAGLERTLGSLADRVVAQSEDEVADLGRMGVRRAGTVIVPSGVDVERFTPGGPAADHRRPGLRRILSVGSLEERKGFADLIEVLRRVPGAELVIVGGPDQAGLDRDPEARRLQQLADRHGVGDRLRIVGAVPQDEIAGWYRSADVLACAPWYEPFGLTPLEAMACGVPVVAYAVGGIAESVIDNVTGVLVSPRDTVALAGALRALLGDEVRRMSFASAAIDRVRSRYTWERTAAELERVYRAVSGGEPAPAAADATDEADEDEEALSEVS